MNYYEKIIEEKKNGALGSVRDYLEKMRKASNKQEVEKIVSSARGNPNADKAYQLWLRENSNEKENGIDSHLRSLIGKKFKKDSDLERAVKQSISAKISDWNGPKMTVFDKQTDEKYILTTEDNNKYGAEQEFWISKVEKTNSKEEKSYYAKIVEQKHKKNSGAHNDL